MRVCISSWILYGGRSDDAKSRVGVKAVREFEEKKKGKAREREMKKKANEQ